MYLSIDSNFTERTVTWCVANSERVLLNMFFQTHSTAGVDARPLHGDSDAVEEDDDQHNVVKHLVGDDLIADDPKPDTKKYTDI